MTLNSPSRAITDDLAERLESRYDPEMFLGRLCWYTIPEEVRVSFSTFNATLKAHGLPFAELSQPRTVDVFKRGCHSIQVKKHIPIPALVVQDKDGADVNAVHANYLVRNAGTDVTHVHRKLFREAVDPSGHELAFDELASIKFCRDSGDIDVRWKVVPRPFEAALIEAMLQYYQSETATITPYAIREYIRKNIEKHFFAIKVRQSGGIYFIQEQWADLLDALEAAANELGGSFHTLPLLDDTKQREMLKVAFETEAMQDVDDVIGEISVILKDSNKTVTLDRFSDLGARFDHMRKRILQYSDLLNEKLENSAIALEIASNQLGALSARIS